MNRFSLPTAGKVNVAALLVFAVTIPLQIAGGVDYPTIPTGLVITIAVLAVITLGARWWWTALFGVIWPAFLTVGAIGADTTADALGADTYLVLVTVLQLLALAVALVSGAIFAAKRVRNRTPARAQ